MSNFLGCTCCFLLLIVPYLAMPGCVCGGGASDACPTLCLVSLIYVYFAGNISWNNQYKVYRRTTEIPQHAHIFEANCCLKVHNVPHPGVCSFWWNFSERQILWSLCSVDFHTLTLQLPIQTPHSVAPELQVFVSSLKFSVKRAHPGLASGKFWICHYYAESTLPYIFCFYFNTAHWLFMRRTHLPKIQGFVILDFGLRCQVYIKYFV